MISREKNVYVVAAHADDETLGCGGVIAKHVAQGDCVKVLILADGVSSRSDASLDDHRMRCDAASVALGVLGVEDLKILSLPDNKLDSIPLVDIVQTIEPYFFDFRPEIVYTHHHGDLNIDHRIVQQAVMTVCRPQPGFSVKEIYGFEVLSSSEWCPPGKVAFTPNYFVDISEFLHLKIEAL